MMPQEDKTPPSLNIIITREFNPKFGNFFKAMSALSYEIKAVDIDYDIEFDLDEGEEVTSFTSLANTLSEGKLKYVPDFLAPHVSFYEQALHANKVDGVFIPPSMSGVMFECMFSHIHSVFDPVKGADDRLWYDSSPYVELLKEASIVLAARKLGIPVFGSCHGAQLLWYMHGGELYSLPKYTTIDTEEFNMTAGMLMNPGHTEAGIYTFKEDTETKQPDGYESDQDEIEQNDYNHNLLMVTTKKNWPKFNAKPHPNMKQSRPSFFPHHDYFTDFEGLAPRLEDDQIVARSFTFSGCIATQWHPHKSLQTKSARHYLHQFGQQCLDYQVKTQTSKPQKAKMKFN